ncbi:D-Ala-D-Ala carboxypeptidase family metallohydrolase [Hyphobacterium sp.]|uniref:D-Ala-D-Ala carboxypeptidase family metallohydrolase n=1 Tax=Hyphobacterium sp. TaxID=2004662 RepID=UPI0037482632
MIGRAFMPLCLLAAAPALADSNFLSPETPPPAGGRVDQTAFDPGTVGFTLTARGDIDVNLRIFTLFAHPGETLPLSTDQAVRWATDRGETFYGDRFDWTTPISPGLTVATLTSDDGQVMRLNLIVMHEAVGEHVGNYRLGAYPDEPYRGEEAYIAPTHFAEVPEGLRSLQISPHFTLGQFLCKQETSGEPFLVLSERLLIKLEIILAAANENGWRTDSFVVMSGYRTPSYNAGIGNGRYSRHIYGGAADIFIDTDGDGRMDDLNGDGRIDRNDAAALYDLVESLSQNDEFGDLLGGLGEYDANAVHGPFVHVDERGWRARWGR